MEHPCRYSLYSLFFEQVPLVVLVSAVNKTSGSPFFSNSPYHNGGNTSKITIFLRNSLHCCIKSLWRLCLESKCFWRVVLDFGQLLVFLLSFFWNFQSPLLRSVEIKPGDCRMHRNCSFTLYVTFYYIALHWILMYIGPPTYWPTMLYQLQSIQTPATARGRRVLLVRHCFDGFVLAA